RGAATFAMALFLGKPAILVEHHEFFRGGARGVEEFVSCVKALRQDLKWTPILETVTKTHMQRQAFAEKREVRFFTDNFCLDHSDVGTTHYTFFRLVPANVTVTQIAIDGRGLPFRYENGFVRFDLVVSGAQTLHVQVGTKPVSRLKSYFTG